jgi:hypothetical protein
LHESSETNNRPMIDSSLFTRNLARFYPAALLTILLLFPPGAMAADQVIALEAGWNAVFSELEPEKSAPDEFFAGVPVEMCAVWLPAVTKVASLVDPGAIPSKSAEWHVWQPEASPAAFLNNLRAIKGRQVMLVKVSAAASLTVHGAPVFERRKWIAPSFNFVGFDVDAAAAPSFARFFDGSRAHAGLKAFKLVAGKWQAVTGSETIQRGRGYWVWCNEGSDFQGPMDVSVPLSGEGALTLLNGAGSTRLDLRANGTVPVSAALTISGNLPLLQSTADAPEAGFGSGIILPLSANAKSISLRRVVDAAADSASGLINLKGGGMHFVLPVRGVR